MQQLPHQHGPKLRHLHDEPLGGQRQPLRFLPQRILYGEGTKGAQGTASFPGHVATGGKDCITCHASAASGFTSWSGGTYVHLPTDTNCSSCHNGTTATGLTTPPHIPVTGVQCSNCHNNTAISFATYTMTHSAVSASRCDACHNGSYTAEGTKGAMGTASTPATSRPAGVTALPVTPRGSEFHQLVGRHLRPSADRHELLELSQRNDSDRYDVAAAHPVGIRAVQQLSYQYRDELHDLHDDALGGQRQPLRLLPQWQPTRAREPRAPMARRRMPVTCRPAVRTAYLSRHRQDDLHELGRRHIHPSADRHELLELPQWHGNRHTTPPHIPVTGIQCSNCHTNTASSFTTYTMSHAAVHATRCDTCHSGTYKSQGTKGAQGPDHGKKTQDCGCCHVKSASTFTSWSNPQSPAAGCVTTAQAPGSRSRNLSRLCGRFTRKSLVASVLWCVVQYQGCCRRSSR